MPNESNTVTPQPIAPPPARWAMLLAIGPSIVWCAEFIGSGEVILATRTGAVLGLGAMWVVVVGVFLKYIIGLAGGWYTVTTGESMIDMLARLPGPKNAIVWLVLVVQLVASIFAIGSIAASAGVFIAALIPVPASWAGWAVTLLAVVVAGIGEFKPLKLMMTALISVTLVGVATITIQVFPPLNEFIASLVPRVPDVPRWATDAGISPNGWAEMLPLLGWGAGGFASQVWYTYWIMGAGYGATAGDKLGKPADIEQLQKLTEQDTHRLAGWRRTVTMDATTALVIGTLATLGFFIAGAQILGTRHLAPDGTDVALTLANLFGENWGQAGAFVFLLGGAAALISTQLAQVAGWPYLLDDATRICMPGLVAKWTPVQRRRAWLVFYLIASMTIVYSLGFKPVWLVKFAAVAEGLVLTPVQAVAMIVGLYWVMPRMFTPEVARRLRPSPAIGVGLVISALVFGYFCVVQLPAVLWGE